MACLVGHRAVAVWRKMSSCPLYFVLRFKRVEIRQSARKHGIADKDIHHVVDHALVIAVLDDDKVLHLGPDRAGDLLEVVVVNRIDEERLVIHSMHMRKRYEPYLPAQEEDDA